MFHVNVTSKDTVLSEFHRLVDSVVNDGQLMEEANKYSTTCRRKHHKLMTEALEWVCGTLDEHGVTTIIQSSYSADVYVDDPGNIDVDVVIPVQRLPVAYTPFTSNAPVMSNDDDEFNHAVTSLMNMGFFFKETRNATLDTYRHHVFVYTYRSIIIEAKIREWNKYQHNLYLVHRYLDSLPEDVRKAWRYIRGRVVYAPAAISKNIKFLWYMVGAVGADIEMKDYPLNIFY